MFYTNRSTITKTFHGVTFRPGETKEVFGIINDPKMAVSSTRQEPPKRVRRNSTKDDAKGKSESFSVTATDVIDSDVSKTDASTLGSSEIVENKEV